MWLERIFGTERDEYARTWFGRRVRFLITDREMPVYVELVSELSDRVQEAIDKKPIKKREGFDLEILAQSFVRLYAKELLALGECAKKLTEEGPVIYIGGPRCKDYTSY